VLTVPYLVRATDDKAKVTVRTAHGALLTARAGHHRHNHYRDPLSGSSAVPLYSLTLSSRGAFTPPDFSTCRAAATCCGTKRCSP